MRKSSIAIASLLVMVAGGCWGTSRSTTVNVGITPMVTGNGVKVSETRNVPLFTSVELDGAVDIIITIDEPGPLTITGDEKILPIILTEVKDGRLIVRAKQSYSARLQTVINVSTGSLTAVATNGSGDIRVTGPNNSPLSVAINGSGDTYVAGIDNESLKVTVNGSGDAYVAGQTANLAAAVSGSGDIDAGKLVARAVVARVAGSGDIDVHATDTLAGTVAGSGSIRYSGKPHVTAAVAGSGDIGPK